MMMRKRYMQYLPLVAAMVALMAVSAFAVAPIIDDLPRVVIGSGNSFTNAVNLDAYVDWFPITATEPWGANRDYPGHASKNAAYAGKNRFHFFLYDPTASRTMLNPISLSDDVLMMGAKNATPAATLPTAGGTADRYGVDPYTGPTKMSVAYSAVPGAQTSASVDTFAVVEGGVNGNQIVAGYQQMTVVTGASANQTGYAIEFVANRANDSFYYWMPNVRTGVGYTALPPRGRTLTDLSWNGIPLRQQTSIIGWTITGYVPTGNNLAIGDYTAGARGASAAYACFIPNGGGGTVAPVFKVKARLVSTAASTAGCPGYRVGFLNAAETHGGTLQVVNTAIPANDTLNMPYGYVGSGPGQRTNGHDFIARCMWGTPTNLIDMGSSGRISPFGAGLILQNDVPADPVLITADGRDYGLEIMCIASANSTGDFIVDSLSVATLANGDMTTTGTAKEWTGSTISATNWLVGYYGVTGIVNGNGSIEGNALLLWGAKDARHNPLANVTTAGTFRLVKATPTVASGSMTVVSNTLYRTTYTVQSGGITGDGNAQYSPLIQLHYSIIPSNFNDTNSHAASIGWYETFGPQATFVKDPAVRPTGALTPGVPPSTLTPIATYTWSHTVPSGTNVIIPEIDVYNTGIYNTPSVWGDADGYYRFTDIKIERIANVH